MCAREPGTPWRFSPLFAVAVGLLLALPSFTGCFLLTGAGHGVYVPAFLLFGPSCIVWTSGFGDQLSHLALAACFVGLYAVYGLVISVGRLAGRGLLALVVVFSVHYAAVGWLWMSPPGRTGWDSIARFEKLLSHDPIFIGFLLVGLFELCVILHLLACQYARSSIPYRPRFTKPAIVVLSIALSMGLLFLGVLLAV